MGIFYCLFNVLLFFTRTIYATNPAGTAGSGCSRNGRLARIEEKLDSLILRLGKLESVFDCGWPVLQHGQFKGNSTFFRGVLQAECNKGYSLLGSSKVTCTSEGSWSELPTCKQDCDSPKLLNSYQMDETYTYRYGKVTKIRCKPGYENSGASFIYCSEKGDWSIGKTSCNPIDCGPPMAYSGTYESHHSTTFKSALSVTCHDGFIRAGPEVIHCTDKGYWDGVQECLQRVCVNVTFDNGTISTECMVKQTHSKYSNLNTLGFVQLFERDKCITYCVRHHPSFSYITYEDSTCTCSSATDDTAMYQFFYIFTYVREGDIDLIKTFSPMPLDW